MRRTICRAILIRSVVLLLAPPGILLAQTAKRPITESDIFDFHWIGDTQISPDRHSVAFVQTSVNPDRSGYQTSLYTLDLTRPGALPTLLTPGIHDTSPRFSPDGTQIAFLRTLEKDGKSTPAQLYTLKLSPSASPVKLTDLPRGASSPVWKPSSDALAVTSLTPVNSDQAKGFEKTGVDDKSHVSDVRIITRAQWLSNGEGYLDPSLAPQVYLIYLPRPDGAEVAPWQLTQGRFPVQDVVFADDTWLLYTSEHEEEPIYDKLPHNTIYALTAPSRASALASNQRNIPSSSAVADLKLEAHSLAISNDRTHLAFHAEESDTPISHQQVDLFRLSVDWSSGKPVAVAAPQNLTAKLAYEMGSGVGGDNTAPRGGAHPVISFSHDGSQIYDLVGNQGSAQLLAVNANTGATTELTAPRQAVITFATTTDHSLTIALLSNPTLIGDLFTIGPDQRQTQLTAVNKDLFDRLNLTQPIDLQVTPTVHAADIHNHPIDTFIQFPPGVDPASRPHLPLILNIHGGPHAAYGWVFDQEMQVMAAKGYVVVYPNPRGSTTYGQNFANIIMNNYPGDDFHDLMDTVDAAITKGYADPARLGVTGGSGGGLLTDWVVTQTTRFKAAVAQRDITDWADWWYTADVAGFHQSFWPKTPPFDNLDLYRAHSPITFVNNIRTPMMFILGDADSRTPPTAGGEQFFRALKYKCIPTVMIRFPRESHELSRSGEPWHRIERLQNITNWFDLYLLNQPHPEYDVAPNYAPPCKR